MHCIKRPDDVAILCIKKVCEILHVLQHQFHLFNSLHACVLPVHIWRDILCAVEWIRAGIWMLAWVGSGCVFSSSLSSFILMFHVHCDIWCGMVHYSNAIFRIVFTNQMYQHTLHSQHTNICISSELSIDCVDEKITYHSKGKLKMDNQLHPFNIGNAKCIYHRGEH